MKQASLHEIGARASSRFPFIDFARGIAMILMAWDHVSGFWNPGHQGAEGLNGLRPVFPSFTQFILRFITHYCAPTFIFLSGTALAISTHRRLSRGESQRSVTLHIIKRGAALLLFAVFIESSAFGNSFLYFGVISCIGLSLIIFSLFRRLPSFAILVLSLLIIVAHPFLDLSWISNTSPGGYYLRLIIHEPSFQRDPFVGLYPIIPWIGIMGLGWWFGVLLSGFNWSNVDKLKISLVGTGAVSLILWFITRLFNGFGNLLPRVGDTLQDWLYVSKYPPDLAFTLWTLAGTCFFMALGLALQNRPSFGKGVTGVILTFGRVPLFFYLVHLWLYRLRPGWVLRPPFQLDILGTAALWVVGLLILWRLCLRYERLKERYRDSLLKYI